MQLDFNDLVLVQSAIGLNSRSEVDLEYMPIFNAPMDTVLSEENAALFKSYGINLCFPRNSNATINNEDFISLGLVEFEGLLDGENDLNGKKICIDVANGNMPALHEAIIKAKKMYPDVIIMSGNVASVPAFLALASTGCDYIRVGVGSGSGCLTSVHTAVGQGLASLVQSCRATLEDVKKLKPEMQTKIVADGGFRTYRDIILALALGADYVMLGGIFNKAFESCSEKEIFINDDVRFKIKPKYNIGTPSFEIEPNSETALNYSFDEFFSDKKDINELIKLKVITSKFRGMSTKAVQKDWGKAVLKSSEGIEKVNIVEYTLGGWMDNFKDYLKSAMSYSGASKLDDFKKKAIVDKISKNAFDRFNK